MSSSRPLWATVATLCALLQLSGCASVPPRPFSQQGQFAQYALNQNLFRVSYTGEAYTRREAAEERLLLHAARTTLQHGYSHFEVLPGPAAPASGPVFPQVHLYGDWRWGYHSRGWMDPWDWDDAGWPEPPPAQGSLTIACYHGEQAGKTLFNAHTILTSLGPKYGLNPDGSEQRPLPQRSSRP